MTALAAVDGPAPLSVTERDRLAELEAVIDRGLATFVEVGEALLEVKASRLYRADFATFPDYLRARWNLSWSRGQQLMTTAQVHAAIVSNGGDAPAASEFALRQLGPVLRSQGPEAVAETWDGIRERHGDRPSAAKVRAEVAESGATPYAGQSNRKTSIASIGEGLATARTRLQRLRGELRGRPLSEDARGGAAELADVARQIAADLTSLSRVPLPRDELCMTHGLERDSRGWCTYCVRPDVTGHPRR